MAGRPQRRARLAAQQAASPAQHPHDVAAIPMSEAPQDLIEARAATSVLLSPLDPHAALTDLYPEAASMTAHQRRRLRLQTTQSERVRAILRNDLLDLAAYRKTLISNMVSIALDRSDPDSAIRAFSQLAKVAGWGAPVRLETTGKVFNVHSLLQNPDAIAEALAMLNHEPGESVAIQSDARDDWEKRHGPYQADGDQDGA